MRRAWAAPALVAVAIAAAVTAPGAFAADPHPRLPQRTARQLVADAVNSGDRPVSGDFRTVADLGLPQLPGAGGGAGQWEQVATGTADWHVWEHGLPWQRVALFGQGRELDVIDNDGIFWTWNSTTQTAIREIVRLGAGRHPAGSRRGHDRGHRGHRDRRRAAGLPFALPGPLSRPGDLTPPQLARRALRAIGPSTDVRVGPTTRVAGRAAYTLDLMPRSPATLVGQERIALDASTGVPLQVQLLPRGSDLPAFTAGFTTVSFGPIDRDVFRFRPPAGARVRVQRLFAAVRRPDRQPRIIGSGWAAVLALPRHRGRPSGLLLDATRAVPGGWLLATRLFTMFVPSEGRMLVGAVPPARILRLAAGSSGR